MKKTEYFALTQETLEVEMSKEEVSEIAKLKEEYDKEQSAKQAEAEAKAEARQAILDRLGLTADEAKLLLG
jgi:hypothetical protein